MDLENVSKNALGVPNSYTVLLRDVAWLSVGYPFRNTCIPGDSGMLSCFLRDVDNSGELQLQNLKRVEDASPNDSHLATQGDVVFRSRGTPFMAAVVPEITEKLLVVAPMIRIRVNRELVSPDYLAWYINGAYGAVYFKEFATGSGIPLVSKGVLEQMPVKLPSLKAQQAIADLVKLGRKEQEILTQIVKQKNLILETEISKYLESL
ncbi:restriction endonuclease subunit S [Fibrobacter sp.]|uniref:restriction endonuclease subunit S n=1 Tax=Fibrobacter sp. TaxID=35828 RepID=UPI0025C4CE58|nr:restriction endonuclease subunit S [Fibrobacter sp.]MBR3074066.1 restriction endonuclease subunit S [Fibrobacter sp.]